MKSKFDDLEKLVTVVVNGKAISITAGEFISEAVMGEKPCGGHGKCGKCKVTVKGNVSEPTDAEKRLLTEDELLGGIRLACMTRALGECRVSTKIGQRSAQILTVSEHEKIELAPSFLNYGVAVDIGTTTLAAKLFDTEGQALSTTSRLNPQSRWGADVISRIEASMAGEREMLAESIRKTVSEMIAELAELGGIGTEGIDGAVITGNTTMLALLCGDDAEPFSHAPFDVKRLYGEYVSAKELGISSLASDTRIYLPPCISAFVGADTVCAILASSLCKSGAAMLADIGTNGEIALYCNGNLTVCSTAAGPAFEGVGISCGMRGEEGAIDKVAVVNGSLHCHTVGDALPVGICGSGLVDAIACMLDSEIIEDSGYLEDGEYPLDGGLSLTQSDVRMVQLAKSAISAGIKALAESEKIRLDDIDSLYIAGGFGSYLNMRSAVRIGLLPRTLAERSMVVGNAALAGAEMMLLNKKREAEAELVARNARVLELSTDNTFVEEYMSGMIFEEA